MTSKSVRCQRKVRSSRMMHADSLSAENCKFKDEKQFYRFMEAKEQTRAKQKVNQKTASPDRHSAQNSPNGAGTPRIGTPPPDPAKRGSSEVTPSQTAVRPESISALVQADCAAHMEYLPSSAVTLPAEATPEEWMEWMLVTQVAEERAGFINVYLAWCVSATCTCMFLCERLYHCSSNPPCCYILIEATG